MAQITKLRRVTGADLQKLGAADGAHLRFVTNEHGGVQRVVIEFRDRRSRPLDSPLVHRLEISGEYVHSGLVVEIPAPPKRVTRYQLGGNLTTDESLGLEGVEELFEEEHLAEARKAALLEEFPKAQLEVRPVERFER